MEENKKSILICEDHADVITYYKTIIDITFDVTTYVAKNGDVGVEIYKTQKPDLVIMDMLMPFNGLDASNLIKEFDSDAKIILASAINGFYFRNMVDGTDLFVDVLHKPIKKDILIKSIKKALK